MTIVGQSIGPYRVDDILGEGGMGSVYRAHDVRLGRDVALKVLAERYQADDDARQRFETEARAASALDHPNICPVFDIGETPDGHPYLVTGLCRGETLARKLDDGPLPTATALSLAIQIGAALEQAHTRGIVHRDIKPPNLMIDDDGRVKILDFGIAKVRDVALTQPGSLLGSPAYMSPEQVEGKETGPATDLWALGTVLYEMLAGARAFPDPGIEVLMAVVSREPKPLTETRPDLDRGIVAIVEKALVKDPRMRYSSARAMLRDLEKAAGGGEITTNEQTLQMSDRTSSGIEAEPEREPSVGVLPFSHLSSAEDQDYFCEGLAEELVTALTSVRGLRVAARATTRHAQADAEDPIDVGRRLGVRTLLTGSVRRAGDRLRITAQLLDVEDGSVLFSERFDRTMEDVFEIQEEIARSVVDSLEVEMADELQRALIRTSTQDPEAYQLYLQGRFQAAQRTAEGLEASVATLERAVRSDPTFAPALAGLADAHLLRALYGLAPEEWNLKRAGELSTRALEIDPELAEAHTSLGSVNALYHWNEGEAESRHRKAIALAPRSPATHHWFSCHLLAPCGRFEEALDEERRALDLDPKSTAANFGLASTLYFSRDFEGALRQCQATIDIQPQFALARVFLASIHAHLSQTAEALAALAEVEPEALESTEVAANRAHVLALTGQSDEARRVLDELLSSPSEHYVSPYCPAFVHLGLGEHEAALHHLERTFEARSPSLTWLRHQPAWDPVRSEPRFEALLAQITLGAKGRSAEA